MIHLNLIPSNQKERIMREKKFLLMHIYIGILVIAIAASSIAMTIARFILINHFNNLRQNSSLVNVENQIVQNSIRETNKKMEDLEIVQKDFVKWTKLLSDFNGLIPDNVQIDFFNLNSTTLNFRLTGMAITREDLIEERSNLENSSLIKNLQAPLSNFLQKENIEFRFAGQINIDPYKNPAIK